MGVGYAASVRLAAFVLVAAGCGFSTQEIPTDSPPPIDVIDTPPGNWTIDSSSGKSTPITADEWSEFITAKGLLIAPPDGLWPMQDTSGPLVDVLGTVDLMPIGPWTYQQMVTGWSRRAVATTDGAGALFRNTTDTSLPDVATSSMLVLLVYRNNGTPTLMRSLLFGGSGVPATLGQVDIDTASRLKLTVGSNSATGTVNYGADAYPLVLKLDRTNSQQKILTDREIIAPPYTALGSSRGIFLGAANNAAPDGRWLYMAAWYGAHAEISDAEIMKLFAAMGF